jgi:hypothetical protein
MTTVAFFTVQKETAPLSSVSYAGFRLLSAGCQLAAHKCCKPFVTPAADGTTRESLRTEEVLTYADRTEHRS